MSVTIAMTQIYLKLKFGNTTNDINVIIVLKNSKVPYENKPITKL